VPKRQTNTVQIPAGALPCFYTDGIVERRGTPIEANLTRLCESITPGPPDAVCAAVMAALIGREAVRDDVALLALQRVPGQ
jgi:phosphoserine phosphatase RsbU/P